VNSPGDGTDYYISRMGVSDSFREKNKDTPRGLHWTQISFLKRPCIFPIHFL